MEKKQQIINKFDRSILGEGRRYGLGFSILKKVDSFTFETLMAFTACKDYLNDFIYIETTGKSLEKIYGFEHEYTGELKGKEFFYTGLKSLDYNHSSSKYDKLLAVQNILKDNYENIVKVVNNLEVELYRGEGSGYKEFTKFESLIDNTLILKTPIFWSKFSFLFSMYGLFIRCFLDVTKEDTKLSILDLLNNKKETFISVDRIMLEPMKKFFIKNDVKKLLDFKYPDPCAGYYVHGHGINGRLTVVNG